MESAEKRLDAFSRPPVPPTEHPLVWDLASALKGKPSDVRWIDSMASATSKASPSRPLALSPQFSQGKEPDSLTLKEMVDSFVRNQEKKMALKASCA